MWYVCRVWTFGIFESSSVLPLQKWRPLCIISSNTICLYDERWNRFLSFDLSQSWFIYLWHLLQHFSQRKRSNCLNFDCAIQFFEYYCFSTPQSIVGHNLRKPKNYRTNSEYYCKFFALFRILWILITKRDQICIIQNSSYKKKSIFIEWRLFL